MNESSNVKEVITSGLIAGKISPNTAREEINLLSTDNLLLQNLKEELKTTFIDVTLEIEKTKLAKELEQRLDISWDLVQATNYDAGYDLRACIELGTTIAPGRFALIPTGLKCKLSSANWEIQIRPRSGLAAKKGVTITNSPGTIDYGYRDEIMVIIHNLGRESFQINPGDRIAQACIRYVPNIDIKYVDEVNKTDDRGGGFGSTGI